ncbi:chloride channel protein [Lyngbya confervoides]|uniref:Chloride channel protein n=1 Tax=Lyngbya confervoides BDU141951 TaxID=1574623 RepID=A0ABD4TAE0_9CYAN|nr:chloride channel protein [Lyngbya confervoides]MCM1985294.1 chloride channel protein [Lyngbya confervoides BDU141951]
MSISLSVLGQRIRYFLQPKRVAILEACLIGLISGLAAVILQQGIGQLGSWRIYLATVGPPYLVLPLFGLLGGLIAGAIVEYLAPTANGSGVPQVKIALAQLPMPLNLRVALVKLLVTTLTLGSGFMLGRQGPTVQIGASLAAQLSYWLPTVPDHRRQMIAAGAGAGLAAGFNAPLAGVLFVVEGLLQDLSGLTLGTAIIASFIGAVVARVMGGQGFTVGLSEVNTGFSIPEIPFYILLGGVAGVLGGLFNQGMVKGLQLSHQGLKLRLMWRIALAGLICGIVVSWMPEIFRNNAGLRNVINYGNDLGWRFVVVAFGVQFLLSIVSYSAETPGGIFAPSLVLGAAVGHLVGLVQAQLLGTGAVVSYSLVGMGAFFGAVSRVPMTGIVIIFEMTTDFNLVLPLMISAVVAYLVAERVQPGSIYDHLLTSQRDRPAPLPTENLLDRLAAADIMQRRVETLPKDLSLKEVREAFARSHHRGFPVMHRDRLVGIVTLSDLTPIPRDRFDESDRLQSIMTPAPITVATRAKLSEVLYLLDHYSLSRLPVVEGRKLVGIITRADIIRVESNHLSGQTYRLEAIAEPSYVVYQTRSPAVGQGRILLPLSNPKTADFLIQLAITLARDRNYELECLQVIVVSGETPLTEAAVDVRAAKRLLERSVRRAEQAGVPVHTQIKVAREVAQAILETEKERLIDLILMGWERRPAPQERIFGNVVDTIIRQASGQVLLVCNSHRPDLSRIHHWLVPIAGGPNGKLALKLMPSLCRIDSSPVVDLCQVVARSSSPVIELSDMALQTEAQALQMQVQGQVRSRSLCATNVADAILELARQEKVDVIILGATREHLLQQVFKGNIPERIARESPSIVIVVRSPN